MTYLVNRSKHTRVENGELRIYLQGEVIVPTADELLAFPGRFELIPDEETPVSSAEIDSERGSREIAGNLPGNGLSEAPGASPAAVSMETVEYEPIEGKPELSELLNGEILEALQAGGVTTLEQLASLASDPDALTKIKGIGKARARQIREALMAMDVGQEGG